MTVFVHQRLLDEYSINETTACTCGGFKCVVHCPACGSVQCYAYKKGNAPMFLHDSPKPFTVRAFRCKQCGDTFTELASATACHARRRFQQKADQEQRVNKQLSNAPPTVVNDILEAAQKHLTRVRGEKPKVDPDKERAKLFEPPVLDNGEETSS